jgi:hypothetical protein
VEEGEGDLVGQGAFFGGVTCDGEGRRDCLVLRLMVCWTYLLPLAAPRQVCHPALEAAVEQQPPVLQIIPVYLYNRYNTGIISYRILVQVSAGPSGRDIYLKGI